MERGWAIKFVLAPTLVALFLSHAATAEPQPAPAEIVHIPAWRLACRLINDGLFEEAAWTHLPSIGVKYIFMSVPPRDQVEATRERLSAHGLKALVLRGDADLSKNSAVDVLAGQLAICEELGVKFMFLSIKGHWPDKETVYARLRRAGEAARKHGVVIALETHPELGTNADIHLQTMKAINHPNVRVNFDTGNITYYNKNTDAATELKKIIKYVATVEIKDHSGKFETWDFPTLGKGAVDIPAVLRILRENRFAGPITIEVEGVKGVSRNEAQTKSDIAASVKYLRSLAKFD